jgi:hypothetical protein
MVELMNDKICAYYKLLFQAISRKEVYKAGQYLHCTSILVLFSLSLSLSPLSFFSSLSILIISCHKFQLIKYYFTVI